MITIRFPPVYENLNCQNVFNNIITSNYYYLLLVHTVSYACDACVAFGVCTVRCHKLNFLYFSFFPFPYVRIHNCSFFFPSLFLFISFKLAPTFAKEENSRVLFICSLYRFSSRVLLCKVV